MKLTNPNFPEESLRSISWTRVAPRTFPHGRKADCCTQKMKKDEIAITIPVIESGTLKTTVIVHKRCLVKFLANVPDEISVIQEKVAAIKDIFVKN